MTSRKLMTLALATVLALSCGGLRATEHQSSEVDAKLAGLAAELATAEQAPAPAADVAPANDASVPAPAAQDAPPAVDAGAPASIAPESSAPTGTAN